MTWMTFSVLWEKLGMLAGQLITWIINVLKFTCQLSNFFTLFKKRKKKSYYWNVAQCLYFCLDSVCWKGLFLVKPEMCFYSICLEQSWQSNFGVDRADKKEVSKQWKLLWPFFSVFVSLWRIEVVRDRWIKRDNSLCWKKIKMNAKKSNHQLFCKINNAFAWFDEKKKSFFFEVYSWKFIFYRERILLFTFIRSS